MPSATEVDGWGYPYGRPTPMHPMARGGRRPGRLARMTAAASPTSRRRRPSRPAAARAASPSTAHTWKEIAHLLANLPMALLGFVYVAISDVHRRGRCR